MPAPSDVHGRQHVLQTMAKLVKEVSTSRWLISVGGLQLEAFGCKPKWRLANGCCHLHAGRGRAVHQHRRAYPRGVSMGRGRNQQFAHPDRCLS